MPRRCEIDQPSAWSKKRRNPVHQDEVAEVIRAELRFESIFGMTEWCRHDTGIGNNHIERFALLKQCIGASSHTCQAGQIERNHFEAATISCGVLPHLIRGSVRFFQIACRASYLSSMRSQRTRGLHSQSRRNTGNENSLALKIYSRQNLISR